MEIKNGVICLTFDDRNFEGWIKAIPLFEKYNAHATFFISGEIDEEALTAIKKLRAAGHTIGLHTKNHANAPEYFESSGAEAYFKNEIEAQLQVLKNNGIAVKAFAYPNNRRNDDTDAFLLKYFNRFRAGNSRSDKKYFPANQIPCEYLMLGFGIGEYYHTVEEELLEKIRLASKENLCMTFFSHNIAENAEYIHMSTQLLEKCLAVAEKEGVMVLGFDQLS